MQPAAPVPPAPPVPTPASPGESPPAARPWSPWAEAREEAGWVAVLIGVLAIVGVLAGVLWWGLAPRAQFTVTPSGPQVIGNPSEELLAADDSVYTLVVAGLGLLAGLAAWLVRRHRGLAGLAGVALGMLAAALVAWQVGELLGPGPSKADLGRTGARVTTALHLAALPALAAGCFTAVLVYLLATLVTRSDDLGRAPAPPDPAGPEAAAETAADGPADPGAGCDGGWRAQTDSSPSAS